MLKYKGSRTGPHIKTRSLNLLEERRLRELVERQSHSMPCGRWCNCPKGCYEPPNVRSLYCACGILALISLTILLAIWFGSVTWYNYSGQFLPTICTPINSTSAELDLGFALCSCRVKKGNKTTECQSAAPCHQVWITYELSPGEHVETLLHESIDDIRNNWQCSYLPRPCHSERNKNVKDVANFQETWSAPFQEFLCYHHPSHVRDVIRVRQEPPPGEGQKKRSRTIHSLLWPAVCSVMFFIGMFIPAFICGCRYIWSNRLPSGVMDEQQQEQAYPLEGGTTEHLDISSRV